MKDKDIMNEKSKKMILVYVDAMDSASEIPEYKEYLDKMDVKYDITDVLPDDIQKYSHIFLDYGGLQQPGNQLFQMMSKDVEKMIENNPSKYFIIISVMGKDWFEDDIGNINNANVLFMGNFMDEDEFCEILEK